MAVRGHAAADIGQGVWCPDGALDVWYQAKVQAPTQQVGVMVLGDSISQGAKAQSWYRQGWAGLVRDALWTRWGKAGEYVQAGDNLLATASAMDAGSVQSVFAPTGGQGTAPMCGWSMNRTLANGDTLTFTPIAPFADFDLILCQENGWSPFTVTVDGVAQTAASLDWVDNTGALQLQASPALSCNSTAAGGDTNPHRWCRYRGWSGAPFSAGTHTVVITGSGGGGQVTIGGLQTYPVSRSAAGIVFVKHAVYGKAAKEIGIQGFAVQFPNFDASKATVSDWAPSPSLCILALGVNDIINGYGANSFGIALDALARRAAAVGASLVFVCPYWNTVTGWRGQGVATIVNIAQAYNGAVVDCSRVLGTADNTAATYVTSAGDSHPNTLGHALIGQAVLSLL